MPLEARPASPGSLPGKLEAREEPVVRETLELSVSALESAPQTSVVEEDLPSVLIDRHLQMWLQMFHVVARHVYLWLSNQKNQKISLRFLRLIDLSESLSFTSQF